MGSQGFAKLPDSKRYRVYGEIDRYKARSSEAADQAAQAAADIIGPVSKSSSFIQCLSSLSVEKGLGQLLNFATQLSVKKASADEALSLFGVKDTTEYPANEFSKNIIKQLREELTAQQRSTESALAIEDAIPRSVRDILEMSMKPTEAASANREQFAQAFRKVNSKDVAKRVLQHVIASMINRAIDAARGDVNPNKADKLKKVIAREFVPKLTREIDRLSGGLAAGQIPSQIPGWADDLEKIVQQYRRR
jgi:hypothetical protein